MPSSTKQNHLLVIGYVWPEPKTTAAGHRMLQLLTAFLEAGYDITFATTASRTNYSEDLLQLGIQTESILLNDSSFDVFIKQLQPNVVIFDRFMVEEQFGWRVAENVPKALRILNTEDLHSLRSTRQQLQKRGAEFHTSRWLQNDMTKREVASIYRSDLTLVVSHYEMELLQHTLGINPELLYHLPFLLDEIDENTTKKFRAFEERKDFICFGNGKHAPNVDAIKYLKSEIWPIIKKELPKVNLNIYGAYLPQQIQELNNPKEGFCVYGWIEDLDAELQRTKINLAPLRFGAGIKGKLTQALQNGVPTIATKIGVEGMFKGDAMPVVVADDVKEFAKAAIRLYQNRDSWIAYQKQGVEAINTSFNKALLTPKFFQILEQLLSNVEGHRNSNFIGGLLQHHTLNSTKYLSKWIEVKNKKDSEPS